MSHFTLSLFASRSPPSKPPAPRSRTGQPLSLLRLLPHVALSSVIALPYFSFFYFLRSEMSSSLTVESHSDGRSPQPDVEVMLGVYGRGSASVAWHRWPRLAQSRRLSFSSNMSIYQRGRGGDVEIGSVHLQFRVKRVAVIREIVKQRR
ncbi:hypothetical protein NL676_003734 [Syzygium grande]|nr:hypothetical protein NL676_003734 [Syzygium grande]